MDLDDESSCSSATSNTIGRARPKRTAALLSGHSSKLFADFQSNKLSETEALQLAILSSIAENPDVPSAINLSHNSSSTLLDSSGNRTSVGSYFEEEEESDDSEGDENNNMANNRHQKPQHQSHRSSTSNHHHNGHAGSGNKSTKLAAGSNRSKQNGEKTNGASSSNPNVPTERPRLGSGRLTGPLNPPKHIRFCAARKFASNDPHRPGNVALAKPYPPSAYHITNPNEPIFTSYSVASSISNPNGLKISTRENRQRIDKCFRNFSLFPDQAIFAPDFKTFLLMVSPKMLYSGGDLMANFPCRMGVDQFERVFKNDQALIRKLEARARGKEEDVKYYDDVDTTDEMELDASDYDGGGPVSTSSSRRGSSSTTVTLSNGGGKQHCVSVHQQKKRKGKKRTVVRIIDDDDDDDDENLAESLDEYNDAGSDYSMEENEDDDDDNGDYFEQSSEFEDEEEDDQSNDDDSSDISDEEDDDVRELRSKEHGHHGATRNHSSTMQKKRRKRIVLPVRRVPLKRVKASASTTNSFVKNNNTGSRSRTKPAWPASESKPPEPKRPRQNGRESRSEEEISSGENTNSSSASGCLNQRPQRKNRPDYLGADLHLSEVRQVRQAIAASLKLQQRQQTTTTTTSSSSTNSNGFSKAATSTSSFSSASNNANRGKSNEVRKKTSSSERDLIVQRATETFESNGRERLIRAENLHFSSRANHHVQRPQAQQQHHYFRQYVAGSSPALPVSTSMTAARKGLMMTATSSSSSNSPLKPAYKRIPYTDADIDGDDLVNDDDDDDIVSEAETIDPELDPPLPPVEPEVITIDDDDDDDDDEVYEVDDDDDDEVEGQRRPAAHMPAATAATSNAVLSKLKNINAERKLVKERMKVFNGGEGSGVSTGNAGGSGGSSTKLVPSKMIEPVRTRSSDRKTRNSKQEYERRHQETLSGHGQFDGTDGTPSTTIRTESFAAAATAQLPCSTPVISADSVAATVTGPLMNSSSMSSVVVVEDDGQIVSSTAAISNSTTSAAASSKKLGPLA